MHKLIKASSPGWEKEFASKKAATDELRDHICPSCMVGEMEYVDPEQPNGFGIEKRKPPNPNSIGDLLATPCGCEFWYEPPEFSERVRHDLV